MRTVSGYFFYLTNLRIELKPDEIDRIYNLILKLYLKSSTTKISTILDKNLTNLKSIVEDLSTFSSQNLNSSNVKELEPKLRETVVNTKTLTVKSIEALEAVEKHFHFTHTASDQGLLRHDNNPEDFGRFLF